MNQVKKLIRDTKQVLSLIIITNRRDSNYQQISS